MAKSVMPLTIIFGLLMAPMLVVSHRKPTAMTENVYGQPGQKHGPADIPKHLTEPLPQSDVLVEADRCDWKGCGSRAYVRVFFLAGNSIDACKHHADLNWAMIENLAVDICDERYKLEKEVTR